MSAGLSAQQLADIRAAITEVPLPPYPDVREGAELLLAEVDRLTAERDQFADRVDTLTAVAKGNKAHVAALAAELAARDRRIADLTTADRSAAVLLRSVADRSDVGLPPNTPMLRSAAADLDLIAGGEPDGDRR